MADQICGIHLASDSLHALALRRTKKGWTPLGGAVLPLPAAERDDASLAGALRAAGRAAHLGKTQVALSLPKQQGIVRNVLLPSTDHDELAQMARFEAERHIPIHAERHCIGYHVLRSMGVEGSEVLLGAVDGPVVESALDATAAAGLKPGPVTLSSMALINSLVYARREWIAGKTIAILAIGLDALDLVLATDGRVLMARSVQMDLRSVLESWSGYVAAEGSVRPDLGKLAMAARMIDCLKLEPQEGEPGSGAPSSESARLVRGWLDRIVQELRRTYDFARREAKCPPIDALVITGEGASLRNLDQYLLTSLQAELIVLNPLEGMLDGKKNAYPFGGLEFVIPFGAAIAGEQPGAYRLDLTPAEHHRQLARRRTMRQLIVTAVMLVVTLGLAGWTWLTVTGIRGRQLAALEEVLRVAEPKVKDLNEMKVKLGIIESFTRDPNSALAVLDAVVGASDLPARVSLTEFDYTKGEIANIGGNAKTVPNISSFTSYLRNLGKFEDVRTVRQQNSSEASHPVYEFKLECPLTQTKKAEPRRASAATETATDE